MAENPFVPLSADLPENWTNDQIVAPNGADVGLSKQHGYNYQTEQINKTQKAVNVHVADQENPHGVTAAQVGAYPFDQVITTQAEFEALIASPDWLGAVSVCFVGDGGTRKFTRSDGLGIKIPQTVQRIQGVNSAIIDVTNFLNNGLTNRAALWYATRPETDEYSISDLAANCTGTISGSGWGFSSCTQLTNCTGTGAGGNGAGFSDCTKLTNCTGTGTSAHSLGTAWGFYQCSQLTNCTGTGTGAGGGIDSVGFYQCSQLNNCTGIGANGNPAGYSGIGFYSCTQLTNCTGTGTGTGTGGGNDGLGFRQCTQLTNCTGTGTGTRGGTGFYNCTQLTNCTGTGTGAGGGLSGYSFKDCKYLNGCKQGTTPSTTGFLGGTNTKVDTATVVAS